MIKYIKIENDQIVELALEAKAGFIPVECKDNTADLFLVNGEIVEGHYNPNEFTPEQIAQFELNDSKYQARQYLASTDWYAARLAEIGTAIPAEVLTNRQAARLLLSS